MKNIYKLLIITGVFLVSLLIIVLISNITHVLKYKKSEYYKIGNDQIPSIYKIIGERKLYYYKVDSNSITIKYKNIDNVISDLNNYINFLVQNRNFVYTSNIDFSKEENNLSLSTYSVDTGKIIIMKINYNKNSYDIIITKEKSNLNLY